MADNVVIKDAFCSSHVREERGCVCYYGLIFGADSGDRERGGGEKRREEECEGEGNTRIGIFNYNKMLLNANNWQLM